MQSELQPLGITAAMATTSELHNIRTRLLRNFRREVTSTSPIEWSEDHRDSFESQARYAVRPPSYTTKATVQSRHNFDIGYPNAVSVSSPEGASHLAPFATDLYP